jgi:hypothetical protein
MGEAFFWGLLGAASLLLGAVVVAVNMPARRTLGLIMGFGSGVLISAVAFELVEEAATRRGWDRRRSRRLLHRDGRVSPRRPSDLEHGLPRPKENERGSLGQRPGHRARHGA